MGGRRHRNRHRKKRYETFPRIVPIMPIDRHYQKPEPPACVLCEVSPPAPRFPLDVLVNGQPSTVLVTRDTLWWVWSKAPSLGLAPLVALDDFRIPREWEESELSLFSLFHDDGWWVDG